VKTKTALVELLKESRDWRTLFKGCANYSAFRLRAQAYRFRACLVRIRVRMVLYAISYEKDISN
jgi:hypothetical protein